MILGRLLTRVVKRKRVWKKAGQALLIVGSLHMVNKWRTGVVNNPLKCYFTHKFVYQPGNYFGTGACPTESVLGDNVILLSGTGNTKLSKEVAAYLGIELADVKLGVFKDGETYIKFGCSVVGKDVVIISSLSKPANETTMEMLLMVATMKRNGAKSVTVVQPYTSYARQDMMVGEYRSLAASDISRYLEVSGVDRVISVDIHNPATLTAFSPSIHAENITAVDLAAEFISLNFIKNAVVLTPDAGGLKRSKNFYQTYKTFNEGEQNEFAIMMKFRSKPNEVSSIKLLGDIKGKDCIIIDDMIDTGGTLMKAAEELKEKGAANVYAFATHGLFNGTFYERLTTSALTKVFITDSLLPKNQEKEEQSSKIVRVPIAKLLADKIYSVFEPQ